MVVGHRTRSAPLLTHADPTYPRWSLRTAPHATWYNSEVAPPVHIDMNDKHSTDGKRAKLCHMCCYPDSILATHRDLRRVPPWPWAWLALSSWAMLSNSRSSSPTSALMYGSSTHADRYIRTASSHIVPAASVCLPLPASSVTNAFRSFSSRSKVVAISSALSTVHRQQQRVNQVGCTQNDK
jgi:hypothetical protein